MFIFIFFALLCIALLPMSMLAGWLSAEAKELRSDYKCVARSLWNALSPSVIPVFLSLPRHLYIYMHMHLLFSFLLEPSLELLQFSFYLLAWICDALCYIVFILCYCCSIAYLFSQWFQHFFFALFDSRSDFALIVCFFCSRFYVCIFRRVRQAKALYLLL